MKRNRKRHRAETEADEINLIPVMNLFVCLIPFLLLTAAFVRLGAVETELPKAGELSEAKPNDTKSQKVDLIFQMNNDEVIVTAFSNDFQTQLEDIRGVFHSYQKEDLKNYLEKLSERFSEFNSSIFKASSQTKFEDAVAVLSVIRQHPGIKSVVLATEMVN